ncbi:TPA: hypothetical protein ACM5W6_002187, partial [Neisseria gonorrhoeae]
VPALTDLDSRLRGNDEFRDYGVVGNDGFQDYGVVGTQPNRHSRESGNPGLKISRNRFAR